MQEEGNIIQSEVSNIDARFEPAISFDPDSIALEGLYGDELTAYRAKRKWLETLETTFLLDVDLDFELSVHRSTDGEQGFRVTCGFSSACGRYAFWRLTHNQAPEVQKLLEKAHIPGQSLIIDEIVEGVGYYSAGQSKSGIWDMIKSMIFNIKKPKI